MMTVGEVSALTGVSIRTLHHYDRLGLLPPSAVSEAGYRLYDDKSLERLSAISRSMSATGRWTSRSGCCA